MKCYRCWTCKDRMIIMAKKKQTFEDHLGCFGDFNVRDRVCTKFCVLNLRCISERDYNQQMEIWEDMTSFEAMAARIQ
jgi:hypothetical protein